MLAPSTVGDERFARWWATFERLRREPGAAVAQYRMTTELDVRDILETVQRRRWSLHRSRRPTVPRDASIQLEAGDPGRAAASSSTGEDHLPWAGDADALLDEVEEFLTGARPRREPDRMLATVLFTDIVGSTARAAELGDRRWRDLLESHDALVRRAARPLPRPRGQDHGRRLPRHLRRPGARRSAARWRSPTPCAALGLEVRAGLHTGECEVTAATSAASPCTSARASARWPAADEVLVSGTVKDLVVGSGLDFEERGAHALKGVPGEWPLFAVRG